MSDWNEKIIAEFRANEGRVGGQFEGAPMVLLHHTGRSSGREYVAPLVYKSDPTDEHTIYVFASAAGAPKDPQWYDNIVATGHTSVEVGTETYEVRVETLSGEERERIFAAQVEVMPGFADYAEKTEGIRVIPVVALHRVQGGG
ncbi:nitroreductase/quinone reductase family protein [uncultured Jatrophihabitans sp.]|uniref:nitroreductase/quinone reductase family protein n=1 Tax=uncultured Jatrophihabitans sp. TaxID=1610747 RepID=UPI0035CC7F2C